MGIPMITPLLGQVTTLDTATHRWWEDLDARDPRVQLRAGTLARLKPVVARQRGLEGAMTRNAPPLTADPASGTAHACEPRTTVRRTFHRWASTSKG